MDPAATFRYGDIPALPVPIPPMDNNDTYLFGRLDSGVDSNVHLIEAVEVGGPARDISRDDNILFSSENGESSTASILPCPSSGMFNLMLSPQFNAFRRLVMPNYGTKTSQILQCNQYMSSTSLQAS